ncbi:hypothetical protein KL942_004181 [Ogataea angusta]|uniref:Uncharacterized protein n=1 Tax=Pichia angusta TaxID=870730 RepID=A0ABQ7RT88_PICAN|nr:hypothetical protein KL942_004181 [Ogataea angusta]KAG7847219.1 hypothetical protein KL940_003965 [Ogataea angusta]
MGQGWRRPCQRPGPWGIMGKSPTDGQTARILTPSFPLGGVRGRHVEAHLYAPQGVSVVLQSAAGRPADRGIYTEGGLAAVPDDDDDVFFRALGRGHRRHQMENPLSGENGEGRGGPAQRPAGLRVSVVSDEILASGRGVAAERGQGVVRVLCLRRQADRG